MAKIVNQSKEKAVEAVNQTAQQANQTTQNTGEATGLLDTALGPAIDFWQSLPPYAQAALVGVAGLGAITFYWIQNREKETTLEATDWREKFENMLKAPVEKNGAKQDTLLYKRSNSASKKCIGVIKKLDESRTTIDKSKVEEVIDDEEKWEKIKDEVDEEVHAVTYSVVRGKSKVSRLIGTLTYSIASLFSKGSNPQAEYFDLPLSEVEVTDEGVIIKNNTHLIKKDGIWQTTSQQGQQRLQELSWLSTHQNWTESQQKLPEFYSDLNMNISGVKNIENTKSENMRAYKEQEKLSEKQQAMEE